MNTDLHTIVTRNNIIDLVPLRNRNGLNAGGRLCYSGICDGKKVKIYSVYRTEQVELRHLIEQYNIQSNVRFPKLIDSSGLAVVEQWIDGPMLSKISGDDRKRVSSYLADFFIESKEIHFHGYKPKYDHLQELKEKTLLRHGTKANQLIQAWGKELNSIGEISQHLRSSDLHSENIILKDDKLFIIDNEVLSYDNGWFLSWCRSFIVGYYPKTPPEYLSEVTPLFEKLTVKVRNAAKDGKLN